LPRANARIHDEAANTLAVVPGPGIGWTGIAVLTACRVIGGDLPAIEG